MITNRQFIYTGLLAIVAFGQMSGLIDFPSMVVRTLDDAAYHLNEPDQMNLQLTGVNPQRCSFLGLLYCGYDVKTTITNTGKSGYANITCSAYDLNGNLIISKYLYPYPHFERDSSMEFTFDFNSNELPDYQYRFYVTISDQNPDS